MPTKFWDELSDDDGVDDDEPIRPDNDGEPEPLLLA
jgi:hypothetical protein